MLSTSLNSCFRGLLVSAVSVAPYLFFSTLSQAQLIPDDTLGAENSIVTPQQLRDLIEGGAIRGENLFHSFLEFNVNFGQQVYFANPDGISNILTRVTGGLPSNIDGVLGVDGTANLFLLNPNGINFGAGAFLDVSGSFFATTANSFVFKNGEEFSATNPQEAPLLTINITPGLQYGENPGAIVNQSVAQEVGLQVQPGETLGFIGGEVEFLGGNVVAPDANLVIGSVSSNSLVSLTETDAGYVLGYEGIEAFEDITFNDAFVNTSGEGGGRIQIQGRDIRLSNETEIFADTLGEQTGDGILINSEQLIVEDSSLLTTDVDVLGSGQGGDLTINSAQLLIQNGAIISASTFGAGNAGNLTVNTTQLLIQNRSIISSGTFVAGNAGDAGDLTINTAQLLIQDGAQVSSVTFGAGNAGNLIVNASDSVEVIGTSVDGEFFSFLGSGATLNSTGNAGDVTINTAQLLIQNGAQVGNNTDGAGNGGNLTVNATDSVKLIGEIPSALSSQATPNSTGNAGDLTINTAQLLIQNGAVVTTSTFGAGNGGNLIVNATDSVEVIGTSVDGEFFSFLGSGATLNSTGNAGDVTINTAQLLIQDGAQVRNSTDGAGNGGNLIVNATDSVEVIGTSVDGEIFSFLGSTAASNSTGNAGDLTINTAQLLIQDGAVVSADTFGAGNGGNLIVNATNSVEVIGTSVDGEFISFLFAQANPDSTGNAGNVTINTAQLLIQDGAQVSTSTFGVGNGGNVIVNATDSVEVIGTSVDGGIVSGLFAVSASTSTGNAGNLTINTAQLLIQDRAQVGTSTLGAGNGGNLIVNSFNSVELTDSSFLSAESFTNSTAGNLNITTNQLTAQNNSTVSVSAPLGQAGNLEINANNISLNNSNITAETALSDEAGGANINLQITELLLLENESQISATANNQANGGNVTINGELIVALPSIGANGSDIFANAVEGNGGEVTIDTQGLFGIEFRDFPTPLNDITASSQLGNAGIVSINQPDTDPAQSITALPVDLIDGTNLVARICPTRGREEVAKLGSFVVTGRGGLASNPSEMLTDDEVLADFISLENEQANNRNLQPISQNSLPNQIIEAQGWYVAENGNIILTAKPDSHHSFATSHQCSR